MTDERMDNKLIDAIARLPAGSGILFRHYSLPRGRRFRLGLTLARLAARHDHLLAVAGDVAMARALGADLVHNPDRHPGLMPHSRSVHDAAEAVAARRSGADVVFVSPLFPTRSHPETKTLGANEGIGLARLSGAVPIALGGMDEEIFADLAGEFHGYAGIDCWLRI